MFDLNNTSSSSSEKAEEALPSLPAARLCLRGNQLPDENNNVLRQKCSTGQSRTLSAGGKRELVGKPCTTSGCALEEFHLGTPDVAGAQQQQRTGPSTRTSKTSA